jgi:serine/threonine protein kinase
MIYSQLGSPATVAPEIIENKPYDFSADLYSLGVILYQWIYGKYPYIGKGTSDILDLIKKGPPQMDYDSIEIS